MTEGIITNSATVSINEVEERLTNNTDEVCISVPIEVCENSPYEVIATADGSLMNYQWYKDGVLIVGATMQVYTITEPGTYTYIADGAPPTGDCMGELCCPIIVTEISCCPPVQCIPISVSITPNN